MIKAAFVAVAVGTVSAGSALSQNKPTAEETLSFISGQISACHEPTTVKMDGRSVTLHFKGEFNDGDPMNIVIRFNINQVKVSKNQLVCVVPGCVKVLRSEQVSYERGRDKNETGFIASCFNRDGDQQKRLERAWSHLISISGGTNESPF